VLGVQETVDMTSIFFGWLIWPIQMSLETGRRNERLREVMCPIPFADLITAHLTGGLDLFQLEFW